MEQPCAQAANTQMYREQTTVEYYYSLNGTGESGTCYAPKGLHCCDLPTPGEVVTAWEPLQFRLHGVKFSDFHGSNLFGWNLFSEKIKELIDHIRLPQENICWLPVIVVSENSGEKRKYYLLHHQELIDALDQEKARYLDEKKQILIGAVLRLDAIGHYHIFSLPEAKHVTYVSQRLKEALEAEKCSGGLVYLKVALSEMAFNQVR